MGTKNNHSRWWFQIFFIFIPTRGNDPIWLIFCQVDWNHQLVILLGCVFISPSKMVASFVESELKKYLPFLFCLYGYPTYQYQNQGWWYTLIYANQPCIGCILCTWCYLMINLVPAYGYAHHVIVIVTFNHKELFLKERIKTSHLLILKESHLKIYHPAEKEPLSDAPFRHNETARRDL